MATKKVELRRKNDGSFEEEIVVRSDWDIIDNVPAVFPPEAHTHTVDDIDATGTLNNTTFLRVDGVWSAAGDILALENAAGDGLIWDAVNNEFDVVKSTTEQAEAGTDDGSFMTPLKTAQAIGELSPAPDLSPYALDEDLQDHIEDDDNPHGVTAEQVGAASRTLSLTAGDGLSGGGDLTGNRTFDVDGTVVRTSGNQTIGGVKTFTGSRVDINSSGGNSALIVRGSSNSPKMLMVHAEGGNSTSEVRAGIGFSKHGGTSWSSQAIGSLRRSSNGFGDLLFMLRNDTTDNDVTTADEKMRITAEGNVGIGTTSPSSRLHVNGDTFISGTISGNGSGLTSLNAGNITSGHLSVDRGRQANSSSSGVPQYNGHTRAGDRFYGGTTNPTSTSGGNRMNYNGTFHATQIFEGGTRLRNRRSLISEAEIRNVNNTSTRAISGQRLAHKFQVVNDLPASPLAGVFYFIRE